VTADATTPGPDLESPRLRLAPFRADDVDALCRLFQDAHVRRYMLDGTIVERAWVVEETDASRTRFAAGELGLFAARRRTTGELIGITGFRPYYELGTELVYALLPAFCGRGFATEMARAMVDLAFEGHGWGEVRATVDAPNHDSIRVLARLGFARFGELPGAFGQMIRFVLRAPRRSA